MKPIAKIATLTKADFETICTLFMQQNDRQYGLDTRMRQFSTIEVHAYLDKMVADQPDIIKVTDEAGTIRAISILLVIEYPDDSDMIAIYAQRCGVGRVMSLPAPTDPHASIIASTLIQASEDYWQSKGATGSVLSWPSSDKWFEPMANHHGFLTYSTMAVRSDDDLPDTPYKQPKNLTIRHAVPDDEARLIQLMIDEMTFHAGITPFDRVVPGIEIRGRERLGRTWSGILPQEGASIFLVAEIEGQIAGLIECNLADLRDAWSYLSAEHYGYISLAIVPETFRSQGIGHHLLQATLQELKGYGVESFSLHYIPTNPLSSRFWQSKGFRPVMTTYQKRYTR